MPSRLASGYERVVRSALRLRAAVIACTLLVAALGVFFYYRLETGFLPEMDEGGYVIDYWTPPGTSLPETDRMVKGIEAVLKATPEVSGFARRTGAGWNPCLGLDCAVEAARLLRSASEGAGAERDLIDAYRRELQATFRSPILAGVEAGSGLAR